MWPESEAGVYLVSFWNLVPMPAFSFLYPSLSTFKYTFNMLHAVG
jgi:hypothetical protein